jgi:hypothetical protein
MNKGVLLLALLLPTVSLVSAEPRYACTIDPSATCDQQIPDIIVSDTNHPTQNSFGPFACTQFWGPGILTAASFSSYGIVGVDVENTWNGCYAFGCGPSLLLISASAIHEFDVVFSSPTSDPIDVIMNIHLSGNIQEDPGLYRIINARITGPGLFYSGRFGQVDNDCCDDIREGMFSTFSEITGSDRSTPTMVNLPVNTPVRFVMSMWVENAASLVTGGAVNFGRGMRLQGTPFTVTRTGPGVSPGDIVVSSDGANISGGGYGGAPCNAADNTLPFGVLDLSDINAFVDAFAGAGPAGDLDGNGVFDLDDINLFVAAFLAGCP